KGVSPVTPVRMGLIGELKISFVHQSGRLQGMIGAFTTHLAMSHASELTINKRSQFLERRSITFTPGREQLCHLRRINLFAPRASTITRHGFVPGHQIGGYRSARRETRKSALVWT